MKIAVFTDLYEPWGTGGIVYSIMAQKAELERLGHEVTVFCPGLVEGRAKSSEASGRRKERVVGGAEDAEGAVGDDTSVVQVPSHPKLRINGAMLAKRPPVVERFVLEKCPDFGKYDVVHVHYEASCSMAGMRLARRYGIPLVQTMHGREDTAIAINVPGPWRYMTAGLLNFLHGRYLPHTQKVQRDNAYASTRARAKMWELMVNHANVADVVVVPAEHLARKLQSYGVQRPLVPVSNGVPETLVAMNFEQRKLKEGEPLKMVWSSRVSNEKRIIPFLQALRGLKRPYKLYVYGDGNAERKAHEFVRKYEMPVEFMGGNRPREEIVQRMRQVHLSVLASYDFDTQGMVLLEAEATGLPVFFCDEDLRSVVPEGGYVFAEGPEVAAMTRALERIGAEDIAQMSEVMLAHREEVLQSAQIGKLLGVYEFAKTECQKHA